MILNPDGNPVSTRPQIGEVAVSEGPPNHFALSVSGQEIIPRIPLRDFKNVLIQLAITCLQVLLNLSSKRPQ